MLHAETLRVHSHDAVRTAPDDKPLPMLIHPSHQPQARRALLVVFTLLAILVVLYVVPWPATTQKIAHFLPLHIALEVMASAIAIATFGVVWSLRHETLPRHTLWLSTALLGVGLLDFSHMLSYAGMPVFITPSGAEKAIYFWLAARLLGAVALLSITLPWGQRPTLLPLWFWTGIALLLVLLTHVVVFIHPAWLPPTFIEGQGLTAFKIGFEYTLIGLNLLAGALLWSRLRQPRQFQTSGLFAAACLMAQSEFFFTLYSNVTDIYNLSGHLYKVIAYGFLYQAIFVQAVKEPYRRLHNSQKQINTMLNALPDLLFEIDAQGRYLQIHARNTGELAAPTERLLGLTVHEAMPAKEAAMVMAALQEAAEHGTSHGKRIMLVQEDGTPNWFEMSVAQAQTEIGEIPRFIIISRNITARQHTEEQLRHLSLAVEQSPISLVITDLQARIQYVNAAFTRASGYSAEEALGHNPRILQSGKTLSGTYKAMWAQLTQGKPWQGDVVNLSKSGREYIENILIYPLRNNEGVVTHYLAHKEDITEKKRTAERIQQLTEHDHLTGLPNRSLLGTYFTQSMAQGQHLAVLWIDLDHFKTINDVLGHENGDLLLLELTHRLRATLQAHDVLSRHAGDAFIAVLPQTDQDTAATVARSLLEALARPLALQGQEISITASIGIALHPDDAQQFDALLQSAEIAMYRVKEEGRNHYCFYAPQMQERTARTLALGNALKQALTHHELFLVYQPQRSLQDGRIVGVEALLRWNSAQWGMVSPGEFIPIAESIGLITSIGEWVLRQALQQLRHWIDAGLPPMTMAVNLSAVQFNQPELHHIVAQALEETKIPAHYLELELTEAVAMKNPQLAAQRIKELKTQGVLLSIDDFGTGYSSLSYLKRFDLDKLKIDQSFVRDIHTDNNDQAITTTIIQLARSLGLRTIAEGVETAEQLAFLQQHGCDEIQGYYFSRPLPAPEFEAFVRQYKT